ncbi:MBL fold metallo-hydrolase [Desulfosporosinus fructosivorans]
MQQITKKVFAATNYRGCDPGYVATSEGIVLIDTPQLISKILELKEEIKDKGPVRMLIHTEHHIDHIFGNHWFQGIPVVAHREIAPVFWNVPAWDSYDYSLDVITRQDSACLQFMPSKEEYVVNKPNIIFDDRLSIEVGDTQFELYHTPGHTKGQTAVYIPSEKVVFTGDTIFSGCQTWLQECDADVWLKSLEFLYSLDIEYIVPGHGPVVKKDYILKQSNFIREWMASVATGMSKGWSKEECVERISFLDRCPVDIGQEESGPMIQQMNVRNIFDYLSLKTERFKSKY